MPHQKPDYNRSLNPYNSNIGYETTKIRTCGSDILNYCLPRHFIEPLVVSLSETSSLKAYISVTWTKHAKNASTGPINLICSLPMSQKYT